MFIHPHRFYTHIEHVPNETVSDDGDRALP